MSFRIQVMNLFLLTLVFMPSPVPADTYPRQRGLDLTHYSFQVTLNDANNQIEGEASIELKSVAVDVTSLMLDLTSAKDGKGMTVKSITAADKPVDFVHESNRITIKFPAPLVVGETKLIKVTYQGVPVAGLKIGNNKHGDRTFFSENWPDNARHWLPSIDHPYDKATSEFYVTAPSIYQVVSNGLLQEETDLGDGRRLTHWKQSVPIPVWLNALGVAPFASHHAGEVRGIPLQTWVFRQERGTLFKSMEDPARRSIELFSDRIGPFPFEKLAGVEAVGFDGGMELASAIFYGERSLGRATLPTLVAHEVAHQWFGDAVTEADWDDVWLSEGFATYFALIYVEHYDGREPFVDGLKRARDIAIRAQRRTPEAAIIHRNLSDMRQVLNPLVYQKAGWVLHMLRAKVGEEAFWTGIREYYRRYRNGTATTDDFRLVMEESSKVDLNPFFSQWLKRAGSPNLEGGWHYNAELKKVEIELVQTQPGEHYILSVEVGLVTPGKATSTVTTFEMTSARAKFSIDAAIQPTSVVLDPNTKILMESKLDKL